MIHYKKDTCQLYWNLLLCKFRQGRRFASRETGKHSSSPARKYPKSRREPPVWFPDSPDGQRGKFIGVATNEFAETFPFVSPFRKRHIKSL